MQIISFVDVLYKNSKLDALLIDQMNHKMIFVKWTILAVFVCVNTILILLLYYNVT